MTRRLRVTVVNAHAVLGGAESWLLRLLDATARLDVDALVLQDGPLVGEFSARGIPVAVHEVGRQPWSLALPIVQVARRLARSDADVVLANGVKAAIVAAPAARLAGVPVVWAKHDHMYDRRVARPLARVVDGLVGAVEELLEPCGRADAVVIPPPRPDVSPASREEARLFWGFDPADERPVLGMVGRLIAYKGVDDAIAALATRSARSWRLVVVGDDDPSAVGERSRLEALAASMGVADRVEFRGSVPKASHWLAGFDALAVLTKPVPGAVRMPDKEGFGTSAFEAMVAGVPVIGVEGGAVVRRLDGGRAGIGVPAGSSAAVAAALSTMADAGVREAMGSAARALVADHPDTVECAQRLASVLSVVAHRPGAGVQGGPAVSVITTVKNEGEGIDRLLSLVTPQLREGDEVVVCDGGSDDDTVARAEAWAGVRVLSAPGAGISEGRNLAIAAASNEWIASTDAGCDPDEGWLDGLRAGAAEGPALVTGLYDVAARGALESAFALACYPAVEEARRAGVWTRFYGALLGRNWDPSLPTGRSSAFTKAAWASVDGFPESLATAEDVLFGRAIVDGGGRAVLTADAVVTWGQRPGLRATARMYRGYGVGDGESGHPLLVTRNLVRMLAYVVGPLLFLRGWRRSVSAAAAVYLSVPVMRARRRRAGWRTWALLPFALAVKDVAKAWGCISGLLRRFRP